MEVLLIILTIALAFFLWMKKNSHSVVYEAEPWFQSKNIKPSSVRQFIYTEPELIKNPDAVAIVGLAEREDGETVGFVIEVAQTIGVVEGVLLQPSGTATQHKKEAYYAKTHGQTLIDRLSQINKATQQRNRAKGLTETKYIGDEK